MDSSGYPNPPHNTSSVRRIYFDVCGTPISLAEHLCLKFPSSRLADIARSQHPGTVHGEAAQGTYVECDVEAFKIMASYLQSNVLSVMDWVSPSAVTRVFVDLRVPYPQDTTNCNTLGDMHQYHSPPSYNAAPGGPSTHPASEPATPMPIHSLLTNAVHERLTNLLLEYILPLVHTQANSGIYRAAFILVPSNVAPLQKADHAYDTPHGASKYPTQTNSVPQDELISLITTDLSEFRTTKIVRLQGVENSSEFLTQHRVIVELKKQLLETLVPEKKAVESTAIQQRKPSKGWFGRSSSKDKSAMISTSGARDAGIQVEVNVEEVSVRRENALGLYETRNGEAVVVQVALGG